MRRPRIPAGHQRVEVFEGKGSQFFWRKVAANYLKVGGGGQSFASKGTAKSAAEGATGVDFPVGQDYVDVEV